MKDIKYIQGLLEKYWEGESSLEEERQLKQYFNSGDVDKSLRKFMPIFQAFQDEQAVQFQETKVVSMNASRVNWRYLAMAASFALVLAAGLWWQLSTPEKNQIVAIKPVDPNVSQTAENKSKIEETPVVVAEVNAKHSKRKANRHIAKKRVNKSTELSPEEEAAIEEVKAALALVSSKIRKGRRESAKGASHLEEIDKIFLKKDG